MKLYRRIYFFMFYHKEKYIADTHFTLRDSQVSVIQDIQRDNFMYWRYLYKRRYMMEYFIKRSDIIKTLNWTRKIDYK